MLLKEVSSHKMQQFFCPLIRYSALPINTINIGIVTLLLSHLLSGRTLNGHI